MAADTLTRGAAELRPIAVVVEEQDDVRAAQIKAMVAELHRIGCAEPALDSEIVDPVTGRVLAMAEAFWPEGLQPGQDRPVVLELDPEAADLPRLEELGYDVFTSVDAPLGYAARRNEIAAGEGEGEPRPAWEASPASAGALSAEFDRAMQEIARKAKEEANYHATYFLRMLAEYGGVMTARKLLATPAGSDGFAALWERGRLDLTVEAVVVQPRFAELFILAEIETVRCRLKQFGYE